ncbi:MAG: glycosyltransferase family 2 protein [Bacteroidota bacterium]
MPQLSVIIVNYRVPHFLEQCLLSVQKASGGLQVEVIVVDNASGDGSVEYLSPRFPEVRFIQSTENLGFAKASNRGFQASKGAYILFLNPDTILSENSLSGPIQFLEQRPEAGALGIQMIDGNGRFLPESKRAFPDPVTAFYKIVGLSRLFPRSARFARYHLGHLLPDTDHEIDVVSGAFFMIRRSVLEKVDLFDEQFFMYGEDIDLSHRIQQAGFVNHYFAGSTIVHFKGESTQKQSHRYVKLFYGAMSQFVEKHRAHAGWFRAAMQVAIALRAGLSVIRRAIQRIGIPTIDVLLIFLTFFGVGRIWSSVVRPDVIYPAGSQFAILIQGALFSITCLTVGMYRHPFRWRHFFRAVLFASSILLVCYSLLPEMYRFSRGIVAFGAIFSVGLLAIWRLILLRIQLIAYTTVRTLGFPALVIGSDSGYRQFQRLFSGQPAAAIIQVEPSRPVSEIDARVNALRKLIGCTDIVFCVEDLSYTDMVVLMKRWKNRYSYRFYTVRSETILPLQKG